MSFGLAGKATQIRESLGGGGQRSFLGQQLAGGIPLAAEEHVVRARVEKDRPTVLASRLTL